MRIIFLLVCTACDNLVCYLLTKAVHFYPVPVAYLHFCCVSFSYFLHIAAFFSTAHMRELIVPRAWEDEEISNILKEITITKLFTFDTGRLQRAKSSHHLCNFLYYLLKDEPTVIERKLN